jgi:uncharacterized protein (DUF3084 family)
MLRIFLILAVVAGLAAGAIAMTRVKGRIQELSTNLETTTTSLNQSRESETKARRELTSTRQSLESTTAELETTKDDLEVTVLRANQQQTRADDLESRLETVTRDRNEAQTELARWQAFERSVDDIRAMIIENRRLVQENEGVSEENRVLVRRVESLQDRLNIYEGRATKVPLDPKIRGQVIAVDPKYEFIVLDIGEEHGVKERGEMLVNRSGKLVAKVRILSVQPQRSIANVLPDWKQAEVMEGDSVIVGL